MDKKTNLKLDGKKIVVGITGCIAAYKACDLVSKLKQAGAGIRVVMTEEACEFVGPLTLRTLSGNPVSADMFSESKPCEPAHIALADWADILVVAPATANIIGKVACGISDDLLSCVIMAAGCPVLIAPAMNVNMWNNPIVRENVKKLEARGYNFIGPDKGYLACGYEGLGRLASNEKIIETIKRLL